jgi:hypothetical protein
LFSIVAWWLEAGDAFRVFTLIKNIISTITAKSKLEGLEGYFWRNDDVIQCCQWGISIKAISSCSHSVKLFFVNLVSVFITSQCFSIE